MIYLWSHKQRSLHLIQDQWQAKEIIVPSLPQQTNPLGLLKGRQVEGLLTREQESWVSEYQKSLQYRGWFLQAASLDYTGKEIYHTEFLAIDNCIYEIREVSHCLSFHFPLEGKINSFFCCLFFSESSKEGTKPIINNIRGSFSWFT